MEELMQEGKSLYQFPFRLVWKWVETSDSQYPAQVAFSVPKRRHKKAVTRNHIKRKIKEVYRTNKNILYNQLTSQNKKIDLMFIYTANEIVPFREMMERQISIMRKLEGKLNEKGVENLS